MIFNSPTFTTHRHPAPPESEHSGAPSPAAGESAPLSSLAREIGKRRPFDSPEQELFLNLIRTTSLLAGEFDQLFRAHGLSESTYNILRILRGHLHTDADAANTAPTPGPPAHLGGRSCSQIGAELVARVPDVTRLLDGLEHRGLIARRRSAEDRRVVIASITDAGLALLTTMDVPVLDLHRRQLGHLRPADMKQLNDLLVRVRDSA